MYAFTHAQSTLLAFLQEFGSAAYRLRMRLAGGFQCSDVVGLQEVGRRGVRGGVAGW